MKIVPMSRFLRPTKACLHLPRTMFRRHLPHAQIPAGLKNKILTEFAKITNGNPSMLPKRFM